MDIKKLNEAIQEAKEAKIKPIKAIEPTAEEKAFLDEMSKKIENEEGISYGELAELQSLQPQIIFINDIRLAEWAGIPEEVWNISGIDESVEPVKSEKEVIEEGIVNNSLFESPYEDIMNCLHECVSLVENAEKHIHPRHIMADVVEKLGEFLLANNVDAKELIDTLIEKTQNEFLK